MSGRRRALRSVVRGRGRPDLRLVAHRGWSAGPEENSLVAFARAGDEPALSGVELDVRRDAAGRLIVSHDPPGPKDRPLTFERALAFLAKRKLDLYVELKEPGTAADVLRMLRTAGVDGRATVFGFPEIARTLPWDEPRTARFGVLVRYPWRAARLARAWRPDVLGLGWDGRDWTRRAFLAWCSVFSLEALGERLGVEIVVGVVGRPEDLDWLRHQGVGAAVADLGLAEPEAWRARIDAAPVRGA